MSSVPAPKVEGWGVMSCAIHSDCVKGIGRPRYRVRSFLARLADSVRGRK